MSKISNNEIINNFSHLTSLIHYIEPIEELEPFLLSNPRHGLPFNIGFVKKAYSALEWAIKHPDADFMSMDSWHVKDNSLYYIKMEFLYNIMNKYKLYKIVSLEISSIDNVSNYTSINIASQREFEQIWLPVCENKKLEKLKLCDHPQFFTEFNIPILLKELNVFSKQILAEERLTAGVVKHILDRILIVENELNKLIDRKVEFSIG
jgi:hypothetical protein